MGVAVGGDPVTPGTRPHQHAASLPVRRLLATPTAASDVPSRARTREVCHSPDTPGISVVAELCAPSGSPSPRPYGERAGVRGSNAL